MNSELNLIKDPIPRLIKKIALPASIGTLFQTLFNIVDTFFAGKISPEALSALAKSFPVYFIIIAACVGVTVGGTSLIANSIGEKNKKKILGYFTHVIIYATIVSIFITLIGLMFAPSLFKLMGSEAETIKLSLAYTNIIFAGSIIFIILVALNSLLHADGDTKTYRNVLILSFFLMEKSRWVLFTITMLFLLGLKEHMGVILIGFGLFGIAQKNYRTGFIIAAFGFFATYMMMFHIMPYFRDYQVFGNTQIAPFQDFYGKSLYLFKLFWPLGFLPLSFWRFGILAAPAIGVNLISGRSGMYSSEFHYDDVSSTMLLMACTLILIEKRHDLFNWFLFLYE